MNQTDLKKGMEGRDALDNEVTALLSALPRVEAPANFEFGIRAKISAGESSGSGWNLVPLLKVAAPLALLFVVTALVFFYGNTTPIGVETIAVNPAPTQETVTATPDTTRDISPAVAEPGSEQSQNQEIAAVSSRREGIVRPVSNMRRPAKEGRSIKDTSPNGGSRDIALGSANTILPPGFQSVIPSRSPNANSASGGTFVPVREVLGILGLTVDFGGGACTVRSVKESSLAERAGMKTGDVIETIDGQAVNGNTRLKGGNATSFVVRRDSKRLNLTIGN